MKKLLAILLAAMMLLSLAACGNNDDNPSGSENNPGTSQTDNQGGTENQGGDISYTKGEGSAWGAGEEVTKYFPAIDDSKIVKEIHSAKAMYNIVVDWTKEEAEAYLNACKEAGYSSKLSDGSRTESDGTVVYTWHYTDATYMKEVKITNETDDGSWELLLKK